MLLLWPDSLFLGLKSPYIWRMEASMKRNAVAERLATEIAEAHDALLDTVRRDPKRWWVAYQLKDQARNGWSASIMNLALARLIDTGVFELKGDCIRLQR